MALTRAALRERGITEKEILDYIMEEHGNTVEAAKEKAKEDAEKAAQKKIDELQEKIDSIPEPPSDGEDWKTKYETLAASAVDKNGKTYKDLHDTLKGEFDTYKSDVETEKTTSAQDKALFATLKDAGANEKLIPLLLKDIDRTKAKFDGDIDIGFTIKNADDILNPVKEKFSEVFGTVQTVGAGIATPPKTEGGKPDYKSQLENARKSGNTQDAVKIKTEAAKEGVILI